MNCYSIRAPVQEGRLNIACPVYTKRTSPDVMYCPPVQYIFCFKKITWSEIYTVHRGLCCLHLLILTV